MKVFVVQLRKAYRVTANSAQDAETKALQYLKRELLEFCKHRKLVDFDIKADAVAELLTVGG